MSVTVKALRETNTSAKQFYELWIKLFRNLPHGVGLRSPTTVERWERKK
jgi:hypothetical protein